MRIRTAMVRGLARGYLFDVSVDATVQCLRQKVSAKRMIPMERLTLSYAGEELDDGRLLSGYGISSDSTVEVDDVSTIKLILQEFGGDQRVHTVDVSPHMELGELKYLAGQVIDIRGIGLQWVALAVGSTRCFDMDATLTDLGIVDGSVVTIVEVSARRPNSESSTS